MVLRRRCREDGVAKAVSEDGVAKAVFDLRGWCREGGVERTVLRRRGIAESGVAEAFCGDESRGQC